MAEAFGKAGYATFVSGKWHNGEKSLVRSFQEARGVFSGGVTDPPKARLADVADGKLGTPKLAPKAVRDDRWKLIRYPQVDRTQLFDLTADPDEATDLAGKPEHAAKVKELLTLLEGEQKRFGDKTPLTVEKPLPAEWAPPKKGKK